MPAYNTYHLNDRELEAMCVYLLALVGGPVTPAKEPTATPAADEPLAVPHPLKGKEQCLGCHASGSPAFPQVATHKGRTSDMCTLCHSSKD
ncbi:MAG: hypothetical protein QGH66_04315 [Dehalococcoidia bacterium]|jgi:hypothetical protein|nr:hypothetical protein [Dehalococcoidia bacterium]MDP7240023.1 hypothetical protein [Dehalococcoidia bacterium]MDP7470539.1 hypothetical protein [Dehalococcoidia bacterium]